MFCENCGVNLGELEICSQCGWQDDVEVNIVDEISATQILQSNQQAIREGIGAVGQKVDKRLVIGISAIIVSIFIIIGIVKVIDGGRSSVKQDIIGQTLMLRDGDKYVVSKKDIKSIEKINKSIRNIGKSNIEIITSDIVLETERFLAKGNVEITRNKNDTGVYFNLKYLPVVGVSNEVVEEDISSMYFQLDDGTYINIPDYNLTINSIETEKEEFEDAIMSSMVNVTLEGDLFRITGIAIVDYEFNEGIWELDDFKTEVSDITYVDGKDLVFSLEDLLNEYNRGRIHVPLIGNTNIQPLVTEEVLTQSGTELIDIYNKKVILDFNHQTPFYDLKGQMYAYYRLNSNGWELSHVEAEPVYTFNLTGKYTGWYELPRSWYTDSATKNNATLEVTKVNDLTGDYEGIITFEHTVKDDEDNEKVFEGSYYITGKYIPRHNGTPDQWNMRSEKWIEQPEGASMTSLTGIVDYDSIMFKGDIVSHSDTFEFKKTIGEGR